MLCLHKGEGAAKRSLPATIWVGLAGIAGAQTAVLGDGRTTGEVLLQITATGEDKRPADDISVQIQISATGATTAEARAAGQAKVDRITAGLIAAGIGRGAITVVAPGSAGLGFIGNEAADEDAIATTAVANRLLPAGKPAPRRFASVTLQVKLSDYTQVKLLQPVLDSQDAVSCGPPLLALRDDGPARRAALQLALAKARADAQVEAQSLGLRIVRLLKASNYPPPSIQPNAAGWTIFADMQRGFSGSLVTTRAQVTLDFAAAQN